MKPVDHTVFFIFYFFALTILALFGMHKYYLLYIFNKHKNDVIQLPPEPQSWPEVTVQLPVYNERYVLKRLLRSIIHLDYPKAKLHIQLLDDSTDATTQLAVKLTARLRKKGYRIDHIRRKDRKGFKAGALEAGLHLSEAKYLTIFDADFVPNPDFLKKTIPHLLMPGIGMVQTRWGHINRNYSLATRLQAIFLDAHFCIEHLARHRSGKFFNFNGTAGIWRREAIIDAGGWMHDTLTEDLDLSYRSQLAGWKFVYLPDVVTPAELPVEMNSYKSQQHRWAKGSVQTALKLVPKILRADLPLHVRLEAIIHLTNNFAYLMMAVPSFLLIPVLHYQVEMNVHWPVFVYLMMFFATTVSIVLYYGTTIKYSLGKLWPNAMYIPLLMSFAIGLSLNNSRAVIEVLLGHRSDFIRTPKFGIEKRKDSWRRKKYKPRRTYFSILEFLIAVYFTFGLVYFISFGHYLAIPFFLLFQFGYFYLSLSSFAEQN